MDGTYWGRVWKYHKGPIPKEYHRLIWFRIIERDWTPKGRHRRYTFVVPSESTASCLDLLIKYAKHGSLLMADGMGFGHNTELRTYFIVDQCCHVLGQYVKLGTEHFDSHTKVHDQTCEASFQYDKLLNKSRYGIGHRCNNQQSLISWMWESDWRNNHTSMETLDVIQTFVEQIGSVYCAYTKNK